MARCAFTSLSLALFAILLAPTSAAAQQGLSLTVAMQKPVFRAGEPLTVMVVIANRSSQPLEGPDVGRPDELTTMAVASFWQPQVVDGTGRRLAYRGVLYDLAEPYAPMRIYRPGEAATGIAEIQDWFDWMGGNGVYALTYPPIRDPGGYRLNRNFDARLVSNTTFFALLPKDARPEQVRAAEQRVAALQIEIQMGQRRVRLAQAPVEAGQHDTLVPVSALTAGGLRLVVVGGESYLTDGRRYLRLTERGPSTPNERTAAAYRWGDGEWMVSLYDVRQAFGLREEVSWRVVERPAAGF